MERIVNVVFFILYFALCEASLITTPSNKAVIRGQRMEMECRTDNKSIFRKWEFLQVGNQSPQTIVKSDNKVPEILSSASTAGYGVDVDGEDSVTLYSDSTKTKHAGVYICQGETLLAATEFRYSAQLIVFESEPVCETSLTENNRLVEGSYIWMQCRVNYNGNWAPSMEWRQHPLYGENNEGRVISNETNFVVIPNSSVTSTLVVLIDSTSRGSYFSCRTYFTWHNGRLRTNATNIPDFTYTWKTNSPSNQTGLMLVWFGVLIGAIFLTMLVTFAVCCVIIRRKTAVWVAKVVSTYENRERPQSVGNSRRYSTLTLQRNDEPAVVHRPERELFDEYASVDDLAEEYDQVAALQSITSDTLPECDQAVVLRSTTSETPRYSAVFKKRPGAEVTECMRYSLAMEVY